MAVRELWRLLKQMKGSPITIPKRVIASISEYLSDGLKVESNLYFSVMHLEINTTNVLYKYSKLVFEYYGTYLQSDLYNYINVSVFYFYSLETYGFAFRTLCLSKIRTHAIRHPLGKHAQGAAVRFGHVL